MKNYYGKPQVNALQHLNEVLAAIKEFTGERFPDFVREAALQALRDGEVVRRFLGMEPHRAALCAVEHVIFR